MRYSINLNRLPLGLLGGLILASLAAPAAAGHDRRGVTLYQGGHFRGHSQTFYGDVSTLRGSYVGNDHTSSVSVPRGCRVTLYRHHDFTGPAVTLRHDVPDMRYTAVGNDEVSSLSVDCRGGRRGGYGRDGRTRDHGDGYYRDGGSYRGDGHYRGDGQNRGDGHYRGDGGYYGNGHRGRHQRGVTVFAAGGFGGVRELFTWDDPDLRDNRIRQDTISSVKVSPGCRAVLFEHAGFRGRATVVESAVDNMRYTTVGNDRVSSIQVDCRSRR